MARVATKTAFTVGLLILLMAVPAFASVNKSVSIGDGAESDGASSINGSITVGSDAVVTGGLETVNGSIKVGGGSEIRSAETVNGRVTLGDGVKAKNLSTVNGSVKVGESSSVSGSVDTVNGKIYVEEDSTVAGDVGNVNGTILLEGSEVGGDVGTSTGDVKLERAVVKGDIVIEKPSFWNRTTSNKPVIIIGPDSRVEGKIVIEHKVELYISDSAEVGGVEGVMSLDDAERFSGKKP